MIRVLHVVDLTAPNHWLNGVAELHDRARFTHLVATIGPRAPLHEALEARGLRTFALDRPRRRQTAQAAWALARILRRERVDIVQTHTVNPTTVGLAAATLARTPLTILTRHHADFTTIFDKPLHRQLDRLHARVADRVWAPSRYIAGCMTRYEGLAPESIAILPHGFDFQRMQPRLDAAARRRKRDQLGGDDKLLVATIARLNVEKGHEYLLQAIPRLVAEHPEARFLFAGEGPRRGELEAMARDLGVAGVVSFLGWRDDAWEIIEAADVIAHPSLSEPFGIVFVESMALEKVVVTTGVSAAPEIFDDGETGLIVPPRDAEALASALLELLRDRERMREMGRQARLSAIDKYDFRKMVREYERCYAAWLDDVRR